MSAFLAIACVGLIGLILGGLLVARRDVLLRIALHHHARSSRLDVPEADRVLHRALWEKYHRAASHPWLPVEPDPSESS